MIAKEATINIESRHAWTILKQKEEEKYQIRPKEDI
ncbi:hypothetical protein MPK9_00058 [Pseudomonas phage MPK9]